MNRQELAEWLDVTPGTIARWGKEGRIPPPRGRNGYDCSWQSDAILKECERQKHALVASFPADERAGVAARLDAAEEKMQGCKNDHCSKD